MADNALKAPLSVTLGQFTDRRANDFQQPQAKGMPCTVTKIEKDIVTVSFDGSNGVWSIPTMKMPQAFSPYGRDPTQVGDKGYASPADYYMGGISDLGGGTANWKPRGNLTPLVFHPVSRTNSETRDYDQYTVAGGPNGVRINQKANPPADNQQPAQPTPHAMRSWGTAARKAWRNRPILVVAPEPLADSSTDQSFMQIDKDGIVTHQGKDSKKLHQVLIDSDKLKGIAVNVPAKDHVVYLGGPGKDPSLYAPVATASGPAVNVQAKFVQKDEDQK